jgi:carboxypeptidase family protein
MGQARTLAVLGALLLVGVGAAVWLAGNSESPETAAPPSATASPPAVQPEAPERTAPGRPRAARKGTATIVGEVRRSKGKVPVEGQDVELLPERGDPFVVKTDARGAFTLAEIPHGGPYELRIASKGCGTVHIPGLALDRGERRDVGTLWLDPAVKVEVQVHSWADAPIEGAEVAAFAVTMPDNFDWSRALSQMGQAPVAVAKARTDAAGHAVFPELATGRWTFTATKEGYARAGRSGVGVTSEITPPVVKLFLGKGHALTGHVYDSHRNPVAGALVLAGPPNAGWDMSGAPLRQRATSDESGRYAFSTLEAGDTLLMVGRPGGGIPSGVATVKIPNVKEFDIVLKGTATLTGTVTLKGDGKPVDGATVRAMSWSGFGSAIAESTSGTDGKYSLAVVEGNVNQVTAEKEGLAAVEDTGRGAPPLTVREGETATRDLLLQTGGTVNGVVKGPDGPIAGAKVWVLTGGMMRGPQQKVGVSDAEGRYEVTGIAPGKALVRATAAGWFVKDFPENWWPLVQQQGPSPFKVDVTVDAPATKDVEMTRGVVIEGTVLGPDGPLAGVRVAQPQEFEGGVVTNESGAFRVEGAKPGASVTLFAFKDGYAPSSANKPVEVGDAGASGVTLKMTRSGRVVGTVTSSDGSAVEDAQVRVQQYFEGIDFRGMERMGYGGGGGASGGSAAPLRADGSYEAPIGGLGSGRFTVTVSALDRAPVTSDPVALVDGQETYTVNLVLEGGKELQGRVQAKQGGAPVSGALVSLQKRAGGQTMSSRMGMSFGGGDQNQAVWAVTDADGRFSVPHLAVANYEVGARADGWVAGRATVDLSSATTVTVELDAELAIEGVVVMADGTPVEGAQVTAQSEQPQAAPERVRGFGGGGMAMGGPSGWTQTGKGGKFRIVGLSAGNYRLNVSADWQGAVNIRGKRSDPIAAGRTDVKLVVEVGGSISGRVVDSSRQPVANLWVFANPDAREGRMPEGAQGRNTRSKEDGTFVLTGLSDGTYTLQVNSGWDGSSSNWKPFTRSGVPSNAKDLEIVLEEGLAISGTLVDAEGRPLPNVQMFCQAVQQQQPPQRGTQVMTAPRMVNANVGSDDKGEFSFRGLAAGDYTVTIQDWGGGGSGAQQLVIENGDRITAGSTGIVLRAGKGVTITGTVVDEGGTPLKAGSVSAFPKTGGRQRGAQLSSDGTFEITGLSPGLLYNLTASAAGRAVSRVNDVQPGSTGLRITCPKGVEASGRVVDDKDHPLGNVRIVGRTADGQTAGMVMTDDAGNFKMTGLAEGVAYEVQAFLDQGAKTCAPKLTGGETNVTLKVQP